MSTSCVLYTKTDRLNHTDRDRHTLGDRRTHRHRYKHTLVSLTQLVLYMFSYTMYSDSWQVFPFTFVLTFFTNTSSSIKAAES